MRSLARVLVGLLLATGMVMLSPSVALACSCAQVTTEQHAKDAETIAVGTITSTASDGIERSYRVSFEQVYKGSAGLAEKLVTNANEASCGLGELATNERYIFFINGKHPGEMRVNLCGGSTKYDVATIDAVESVTGAPVEPFPSFGSGPTVASDSTDPIRVAGIGAIVIGAIFGVVLMVRRRTQGKSGRQYLG